MIYFCLSNLLHIKPRNLTVVSGLNLKAGDMFEDMDELFWKERGCEKINYDFCDRFT